MAEMKFDVRMLATETDHCKYAISTHLMFQGGYPPNLAVCKAVISSRMPSTPRLEFENRGSPEKD